MICVERDERGVTLRGHAGYGRRGEDIVCAAVSILVYVQVRIWEKAGVLETFEASDGFARLTVREDGDARPEILELGLRYLAGEYPGCVKMVNE